MSAPVRAHRLWVLGGAKQSLPNLVLPEAMVRFQRVADRNSEARLVDNRERNMRRTSTLVLLAILATGCSGQAVPTPDLVGTQVAVLEAAAATTTARAPTATPTPSPTPTPGIGSTLVRELDGMVMVYVPAGAFQMGSSYADPEASDDEKPAHTVYLDAFWIDRTEVTNAQSL